MFQNQLMSYLFYLSVFFVISPISAYSNLKRLSANPFENKVKNFCPSSYFKCGDGTCVSFLFLCDGEPDCNNGADEFCNGTVHKEKKLNCEEGKFSCPGIDICFPSKWLCDGHSDCPDSFDEKNCTIPSKCEGFRCGTGECIPEKWKCDKNFDCADGSDEANCKSSRINKHCIRENGYFECASGRCISHDKVCNGKNDCQGGDDEGKFCDIDGCHSKNCTHGCFQTPTGAQCDCNSGFKLDSDQRTCIDIDECKENPFDICSHKCTNMKGSFKCSCENGFKLVNQTKCIAESAEPVLLFTDSHNVRGYWMKRKLHFLIARGLNNAMGIDMHHESKLVFWTDIGVNASYVFSAHFHNKEVKAIVTSGLKKPEDIAVDYVANNLYISDAGLKQIIVCKLDGSSCTAIVKRGIDNIRAIALDIQNGRMFWTDWGLHPGIYTARTDGSKMKTLVNRNIIWPNGLTYDRFKNRIYWSDAKLERIEYYDLTLNKRFLLIDDQLYHPHCLTMFEDDLYWADWDTYNFVRTNKFTGHNMTSLFRRPHKTYGMHIYHPSHYTSSVNPCWSSSCSHLCLITSPTEFRCACPNNMKLDPFDKTTCIEEMKSTSLIVGLEHTVKLVWPNNIGRDITQKLIKTLPKGIDHIDGYAYKNSTDILFLHNSHKPGIIKFSMRTLDYPVIFDKNNSSIYSLTYDEFSDNLYWLDIEKNHLVVGSIDGRKKLTLLDNLRNPSSIALYQERNELFIGLTGEQRLIMVTDLDGKNSKVLVNNIGLPSSLAVCKKYDLLYWADAKKGTIESISLNDPTSRNTLLSGLGQIESLVIKDQMLYWTIADTPYLYSTDLSDKSKEIKQSSLGIHTKVPKKLILPSSSPVDNDCLTMKNKCSDICLFKGFKIINKVKVPLTQCICPSGTSLSADHRTCQQNNYCPDGYFTCHSTKTCIRSSEVCDGHKNCPNNEDEIGCPDVKPCSIFESRCDPKDLKSKCIPNLWFCDGEQDCANGFDELNCHNHSAKTIYEDVAHKSTVNDKCEAGYFKCDKNVCIPWHFVCNGEFNCNDKTDEGENCMSSCKCKNNGRCHLDKEKTWSCQCSPQYEGQDCSIPRDLTARSNGHQIVMKESLYTKSGRIEKTDGDTSYNDGASSFWLVMLIVVIVLLIAGLVLSGYMYVYERDGRLVMLKRNLDRKLNFRNNSTFQKQYDYNSATVDLLDQMECEPDDEDPKCLNQQQVAY